VARLPTPGGDEDTWGNILNTFLDVAHNTDGTLKTDAVATGTITNGTVTEVKLATALATKVNSHPQVLPYSYGGALAVVGGTFRLYNDSGAAWTITSVRASVGTAPTGASVIVDVNVDGTTIFSTQANRPTIAAAANTSSTVTNMNTTSVANGSYLTVDIDQVGSTVAGSDLSVQVGVK